MDPRLGDLIRIAREYMTINSNNEDMGRLTKDAIVVYLGQTKLDSNNLMMVCQIVVAPNVGCIKIPGTNPGDLGTVI